MNAREFLHEPSRLLCKNSKKSHVTVLIDYTLELQSPLENFLHNFKTCSGYVKPSFRSEKHSAL